MTRDLNPRQQANKPKSSSRGGTLVGIFVGLILGALVAAGIALYFASSSPFNRLKQAEERPLAAPPPRPQSSEPIALPGKAGDKPVEKPRFDFYEALPKGAESLPPPSKPEETAEVVKSDKPTKEKPESAPAKVDKTEKARPGSEGIDAAERAKAEAALLDKPVAPEKFYLQAGAFEDPSEADNLKARLALMGVEASVQKVEVADKGTLHRVRTGPYMGQDAMTRARDNLAVNGISTTIIKIKPKEPKPAVPAQ